MEVGERCFVGSFDRSFNQAFRLQHSLYLPVAPRCYDTRSCAWFKGRNPFRVDMSRWPVSQGSRETRQPWAISRNSFGVEEAATVLLAPKGPQQSTQNNARATPWEERFGPHSSPERAAQFPLSRDPSRTGTSIFSDSTNDEFGVEILESSPVAPFQGSRIIAVLSPGRCPGLICCSPSG
jgi:hypothetical protein